MFTLSASMAIHGRFQRGDRVSRPTTPPENNKNRGFFSNMGQYGSKLPSKHLCSAKTVLLSTHNIWFGREIRTLTFKFPLVSRGLAPTL